MNQCTLLRASNGRSFLRLLTGSARLTYIVRTSRRSYLPPRRPPGGVAHLRKCRGASCPTSGGKRGQYVATSLYDSSEQERLYCDSTPFMKTQGIPLRDSTGFFSFEGGPLWYAIYIGVCGNYTEIFNSFCTQFGGKKDGAETEVPRA